MSELIFALDDNIAMSTQTEEQVVYSSHNCCIFIKGYYEVTKDLSSAILKIKF